MPANLSNSLTAEVKTLRLKDVPGVQWPGRLLLLALNFLPLALVVAAGSMCFVPAGGWPARTLLAVAVLYLAPPLATRLILSFSPLASNRIAVGSTPFFAWWATFQLQVLFCRFSAFEEALRIVPGLYSLWLRLWGAKIGRLTYWAPKMSITDRSFLALGNDVVFGAGVHLNAHVLAKNPHGVLDLILAPVKVGDRTLVGGYSVLTAGTEIAADNATRAGMIFPPFSVWKDGKRSKGTVDID